MSPTKTRGKKEEKVPWGLGVFWVVLSTARCGGSYGFGGWERLVEDQSDQYWESGGRKARPLLFRRTQKTEECQRESALFSSRIASALKEVVTYRNKAVETGTAHTKEKEPRRCRAKALFMYEGAHEGG